MSVKNCFCIRSAEIIVHIPVRARYTDTYMHTRNLTDIFFATHNTIREITDDSVERDLYLFYIQYKVYIDIVSVLKCDVKNAYSLTREIKLDNHTLVAQ